MVAEVCDRDAMGSSRLDAGLDGRANVVDVHVHVPQILTPDDQDRVAETVSSRPESADTALF